MSDFRFACPSCGQRIQCDATNRGMHITCPACQKPLTIPAPAARAPVPTHHSPEAAPASTTAPKISALALVSLGCSFGLAVGSIPGIICGHLAMRRMRRDSSLRGKGLALAGLSFSYLSLLGAIAFLTTGFFVLRPQVGHQLTVQEQAANTPAALAARRLDEIKIGNRESEAAHQMKTRSSRAGVFSERPVREARNGGMIGYEMKVDSNQPASLYCTYWGNDSGRRFDILVNEKVIATQVLDYNDSGHFFDVEYMIPQELTRGRTNISVVFQGYPRKTVGGLFGCQTLKRKD